MNAARCPSDLALERHLRDPARSALVPHLAACPACRERVARMGAEAEDFHRFVYPATVGAVEDAAERAAGRRAPWRLSLWLAPVAAAAAAVALWWGPGSDYVGTKGFPFTAWLADPAGARAVKDGGEVPAAGALRFRVQPPAPCRLWIVSVDALGQVSRLYPAEGEGGAELRQGGALPGGAVLDGRPGPERLFAVCAREPMPFARVEQAARAAAAGGAGAVRSGKVLPGMPRGAVQATLLLEKRP
jgi:anti-sigma factor RsiW